MRKAKKISVTPVTIQTITSHNTPDTPQATPGNGVTVKTDPFFMPAAPELREILATFAYRRDSTPCLMYGQWEPL